MVFTIGGMRELRAQRTGSGGAAEAAGPPVADRGARARGGGGGGVGGWRES
jgi:hypothetical protein